MTVAEAPITTMIQTVGLNAPPISGKKKRRSAGYDDYNDDGGGYYDCTCENRPKRDNNSADQDPIELGQAILGGKAIFSPTDYHLLQLYIDTELVRTIVIKQKPT